VGCWEGGGSGGGGRAMNGAGREQRAPPAVWSTGGGRRPTSGPEVSHLIRVRQRYPDLSTGIERLITLIDEERDLRSKGGASTSHGMPRERTTWKGNMGITIVQ